jgi:transposase
MGRKRRNFSPEFKAKIALEALKEIHTIAEIAQKYELHPVQVSKWKKELKDNVGDVFKNSRKTDEKNKELEEAKLYEKIGRLEMELDWLKKKTESLN